MSYEEDHSEEACDKCKRIVGKANLIKVPFAYLDCNDKKHEDISELFPKRSIRREVLIW